MSEPLSVHGSTSTKSWCWGKSLPALAPWLGSMDLPISTASSLYQKAFSASGVWLSTENELCEERFLCAHVPIARHFTVFLTPASLERCHPPSGGVPCWWLLLEQLLSSTSATKISFLCMFLPYLPVIKTEQAEHQHKSVNAGAAIFSSLSEVKQ